MSWHACLVIRVLLLLAISVLASASSEMIQVREDFSKDPGWEWRDNRVVAQDPPTIKQDFGWAPTNNTGAGPGEIGGRMWQSTTPAYYAIPLNRPLSFKDKFSFSARISFMPTGGAGVAYLGFFNHELQGWRIWNSMAVRLGGESSGQAAFGADAMTAKWRACGATEGYYHVPMDGKPHTLRFTYDPKMTRGPWPDPRLSKYVTAQRQSTEQILEQARKDEPDLTKEELWKRLEAAYSAGLIYYIQRTGHESIIGGTDWNGYFWGLAEGKNAAKERMGAMIIQVDDKPPFKVFIFKEAQDEPVYMDRFGLFNLQMYHQYIDLYLSDMTVNGHKVDLSKDPGWEGKGNRVQFVEQSFQHQDFGYSETNWAGDGIGEIGGIFYRVEAADPNFGYYADDIGKLSLDDPISFSGNLCFVEDSTDTGMYFGFFNSKALSAELSTTSLLLKTPTSSLGILIEGHAQEGKFICPQFTSSKDSFAGSKYGKRGSLVPKNPSAATSPVPTASPKKELLLLPDKQRHVFTFNYDPKANNNLGRITATLDDQTISINLNEQQRAEGAVFDHFGLASLRTGGKFMKIYLDDLTYTARRPMGYKPVFHKQEVTRIPFPKGGRKY